MSATAHLLIALNEHVKANKTAKDWNTPENQIAIIAFLEKHLPKAPTRRTSKGEDSSKAPRKPMKRSAYLCFCDEKREILKGDNPDMIPKEITKEMGRMWSELKESKKPSDVREFEKYTKMSEESPLIQPKNKATKSTSSSDSSPNPNRKTPYRIYCDKNRSMVKKDNPSLNASQLTKELSRRWDCIKERMMQMNTRSCLQKRTRR